MNTAQQEAYDKAQIMLAFARGEKVEMHGGDSVWMTATDPCWNFDDWHYRIAPEPKPRPWTAADVPPVCWVRIDGEPGKAYLVTGVGTDRIYFECHSWASYEHMRQKYEWSADLKTWRKCEVAK